MKQSPKNISDNPIVLDANVLLEILLNRKQNSRAREIVRSNNNLYISALSAHLVVHFGSEIVSLPILKMFLNDYKILNIDQADFDWAFNNLEGADFEDALQLGCTIRHGIPSFITFDKQLYNAYKSLGLVKISLIT